MPVAWSTLAERANADPEFRLHARFWNATLRLDVGEARRRLVVEDGAIREVEPCGPDAASDVQVSIPADVFERMCEPVPKPFYHDLFGAVARHGVVLLPEPTAWAAYYPALRRLTEILRDAKEVR